MPDTNAWRESMVDGEEDWRERNWIGRYCVLVVVKRSQESDGSGRGIGSKGTKSRRDSR